MILKTLRLELWALFLIECVNRDDFYITEITRKMGITASHGFALKNALTKYEFIYEFKQSDKREAHYILTKKGKDFAIKLLEIKNHFDTIENPRFSCVQKSKISDKYEDKNENQKHTYRNGTSI